MIPRKVVKTALVLMRKQRVGKFRQLFRYKGSEHKQQTYMSLLYTVTDIFIRAQFVVLFLNKN